MRGEGPATTEENEPVNSVSAVQEGGEREGAGLEGGGEEACVGCG
jgi:hypothetical protein